MRKNIFCQLFLSLGILCILSATGSAMETDSWVFRSEIAPGQSIWSPDISIPSYDFTDGIYFNSGMMKGTGVEYSVKANAGTVSGNVEGMIKAQYNNRLSSPGHTTVNLNYGGIANESKISTSLAVALSGRGIFKVDYPWWINIFATDLDYSVSLGFLDLHSDTNTDFTTGPGNMVVAHAVREILPFNGELGLIGAKINFNMKQDIYFTPQTIKGTVKYTHVETQTGREVEVEFPTSGGALDLALDLNLDLPGHWEVSLENFMLDQNTFNQDLDFAMEMGVGVPLLGVEFSLAASVFDMFDLFEVPFALDFLAHGYDGLDNTIDRLGRFYIYVDGVHAPVPGALWLFGSGIVALLGLRRKPDSSALCKEP